MSNKNLAQKLGDLNIRDVADTTDEVSQASEFCETSALVKISKNPVSKLNDNKATQNLESLL